MIHAGGCTYIDISNRDNARHIAPEIAPTEVAGDG